MKKLLILLLGIGFFIACDDEADLEEQGFVLTELPGYVAFNATGTNTTLDDEDVSETDGSVTFNIEVPTGTLSDITVNYEFGGSALFGTDFTVAGASAAGGSIVLRHVPTDVLDFDNVDLDITLLTDAVADGDKVLTVTLLSASNAEGDLAVGRGGQELLRTATVNIADVALMTSLSTDALSLIENSVDTATFSVGLNFAAPEDVTVTMASAGDLMAGTDFMLTDGDPMTVVIPAGETSVEFGFKSVDDNDVEMMDSVIYSIASSAIAGTGLSVTTGGADSLEFTISDEVKTLEFNAASDSVVLTSLNDAGFYEFPVELSITSDQDDPLSSDQMISIDYTLTATGGVAGVDFVDQGSGTITFEAGQTRSSITIQVLPAAFSNANNVNVSVELDGSSLTTADAEISVGTSLEVDVTVDNE